MAVSVPSQGVRGSRPPHLVPGTRQVPTPVLGSFYDGLAVKTPYGPRGSDSTRGCRALGLRTRLQVNERGWRRGRFAGENISMLCCISARQQQRFPLRSVNEMEIKSFCNQFAHTITSSTICVIDLERLLQYPWFDGESHESRRSFQP